MDPSLADKSLYQKFQSSWELSWTTFSTVGYGVISPSTTNSDVYVNEQKLWGDNYHCFAISTLGSLEAFMGIMFVGFFGAIVFAKISKIHGQAQILFSSLMVVRFDDDEIFGYNDELPKNETNHDHRKCPFLEFRILNTKHNTHGGEIMNAKIRVVASLVTNKFDPSFFTNRIINPSSALTKTKMTVKQQTEFYDLQEIKTEYHLNNRKKRNSLDSEHVRNSNDKDHDAILYINLQVEPDFHPFFKRVWRFKHILDKSSPLLNQSARKEILLNNGYWPEHWTTNDAVQSSFHFDQILVLFSGIENSSAHNVYAQKIYDFNNMNCIKIGWQFVSMMCVDPLSGKLVIHENLLNEVNLYNDDKYQWSRFFTSRFF